MSGASRVSTWRFQVIEMRTVIVEPSKSQAEGTSVWKHVSMIPLSKVAWRDGRQLELPVFRARLASIFNGEPGWLDAGAIELVEHQGGRPARKEYADDIRTWMN